MNLKNKMADKKGFTLVELLLVILIIVIIGLILIPNIIESLNDSRIENAKSIEKLLIKNLEMYNNDHEADLWMNSGNDYSCNDEVTISDLVKMNPDIKLGECLLNCDARANSHECADANLVIEKLGNKKYKYYVGLSCGKKIQPLESVGDKKYIFGAGEELYYKTDNQNCNKPFTIVADPNKGTIANANGWEMVGDKAQLQVQKPGVQYPALPGVTRDGFQFEGWNTDKDGKGDVIVASSIASLNVKKIYAQWSSISTAHDRLIFDNQTITKPYKNAAQSAQIISPTNGQGPYSYTEKSEKRSDGTTSDYFSISNNEGNPQIIIAGATPVGTYHLEIEVVDETYGADANNPVTAIYSITIERRIQTVSIPKTPTTHFTYDGSVKRAQDLGLSCPSNTRQSSSSQSSGRNAGTYNVVCELEDTVNYKWEDDTTSPQSIKWIIDKATCPKPTNISVSPSGEVNWAAATDNPSYKMSFDNTNWNDVIKGGNYLNDIISQSGNRTLYLKAYCDGTNYTNTSEVAEKTIEIKKISFESSNENRGTVDVDNYNVIKGASVETNGNKLLIKASNSTLKTITATPKTGHTFNQWSKTSGTLDENQTITASFDASTYTVNVNVTSGTVIPSTKTVEYNGSTTFTLESDKLSLGYVGKASCTNGKIVDNILTVSNVTSDTTCVVSYVKNMTVLYPDGTLIINEHVNDRDRNIEQHQGEPCADCEFLPLSEEDNNLYIFTSPDNRPWYRKSDNVKTVRIGDNIKPINTDYWFYDFINTTLVDTTSIANQNQSMIDTSDTTTMRYMFYKTGYNAGSNGITLTGLQHWDTTNVTDMHSMFEQMGYNNTGSMNIEGNLSNWNTQNVTDMGSMFANAAYYSRSFTIDLSNWNKASVNYHPTASVTNLSSMFEGAGYSATTWSIGDLSNWGTYNVTQIHKMFRNAGYSAQSTWNIGSLANWNVSSVTNMNAMFQNAGYNARTFNIGDLSSWDTTNVTNMNAMFQNAGYSAETFDIGNLSTKSVISETYWNVSNVTDMSYMFANAGYSAQSTWNIGSLANWNVSSVTNMNAMFQNAGYNAETFNLDLSTWRPLSAISMDNMFNSTGYSATTWSIGLLNDWRTPQATTMKNMFSNAGFTTKSWSIGELDNWNVSNVTYMNNLFYQAGFNSESFKLGNLDSWSVSNVINMSNMFNGTGRNSRSWKIGDIGGWNVSNVTTMNSMFFVAGYQAEEKWNPGDLSNWNVSNVTDMSFMFYSSGFKAHRWNIGDIGSWNVSKVTDMSGMFYGVAKSTNAADPNVTIIGDLSNWDTSLVRNMTEMFYNIGSNEYSGTIDIGSLNIYASNINNMFNSAKTVKVTINLYSNPRKYDGVFDDAVTATGSGITVNYSRTTNIDSILGPYEDNEKIIKGNLLD